MTDRLLRVPPLRQHLAGTLALARELAAYAGGTVPADVLALLDRPGDLPADVDPEKATLKYDLYLAASPAGRAWGVSMNDHGEPAPFAAALRAWLGDRLAPVDHLRAVLGHVPATTVAAGFDHPGGKPRVKVYLKEARWGAGLIDAARLRHMAHELFGIEVPAWLRDRPLGVVTVELYPDGSTGLKLYPGGPTPAAAAGEAPGVGALVAGMTHACPLPGWYYLTVRLRVDTAPRCAINKIYNTLQIAFTDEGAALGPTWADAAALFEHAGLAETYTSLRERLEASGLRIVPTATALEEDGHAADVYVAAWTQP